MILDTKTHPAVLKDGVTSKLFSLPYLPSVFTLPNIHRVHSPTSNHLLLLSELWLIACSAIAPGGCTIAGLMRMEDGNVRSTLARTIEAATLHATGLGQEKK
jgi:hypothetical protein